MVCLSMERESSLLKPFLLTPDQDHRLAMACGVLMESGHPIELQNPICVQKSFPDFWEKIKETSPLQMKSDS